MIGERSGVAGGALGSIDGTGVGSTVGSDVGRGGLAVGCVVCGGSAVGDPMSGDWERLGVTARGEVDALAVTTATGAAEDGAVGATAAG